jgi:hypothetical protein
MYEFNIIILLNLLLVLLFAQKEEFHESEAEFEEEFHIKYANKDNDLMFIQLVAIYYSYYQCEFYLLMTKAK